jgi:hypothetical protein
LRGVFIIQLVARDSNSNSNTGYKNLDPTTGGNTSVQDSASSKNAIVSWLCVALETGECYYDDHEEGAADFLRIL